MFRPTLYVVIEEWWGKVSALAGTLFAAQQGTVDADIIEGASRMAEDVVKEMGSILHGTAQFGLLEELIWDKVSGAICHTAAQEIEQPPPGPAPADNFLIDRNGGGRGRV